MELEGKMTELYNCDCIEYMKGMEEKSVDFVLTDIPYGEVNERLKARNRFRKNFGWTEKGKADKTKFALSDFLPLVAKAMKKSCVIFCGIGQLREIFDFFQKGLGWPARQLVWEKTNPTVVNGDKMYLSGTENAVWAKRPGAPFKPFCKSNVFRYPTIGGASGKIHPTEKSHGLLRELILDNTEPGDLVFDPCAGSGSTLLVASQEGRRSFGCELNGVFYQKAKARLEKAGFQPVLF